MTNCRVLAPGALALGVGLVASVVLTGCPSPLRCTSNGVLSPIVTVSLPNGQRVCDASVTGTVSDNAGVNKVEFQATGPGRGCEYLGPGTAGIYRLTVRHGSAVKVIHMTVTNGACQAHVVRETVTVAQ